MNHLHGISPRKYTEAGFGLIEVLIAAGILALVVGGNAALYTAMVQGLRKSVINTTASDLLNEGAEQVRNLRDTALIDSIPTNRFSQYLDVDRNNSPISTGVEYRIIRNALGQFRLEAGRESLVRNGQSFERSVMLSAIEAPGGGFSAQGQDFRYVTVRVRPAGGTQREVKLILSDWRP